MSIYDSTLRFYGLVTVCTDVKLKQNKKGTDQTMFSIVISRDNMAVNREDARPEFFRCVAYDGMARSLSKRVCKGSKVFVEGHLRQYFGKQFTRKTKTGKEFDNRQSYVSLQLTRCIWVGGKKPEKDMGADGLDENPENYLLDIEDLVSVNHGNNNSSASSTTDDYIERPQNNDDGVGDYLPEESYNTVTNIEFNDPDDLMDDLGVTLPWE